MVTAMIQGAVGSLKSYFNGGTPGELAHATIVGVDPVSGDAVCNLVCQFNPQELTITKGVRWVPVPAADMNSPFLVCAGGAPASFSLNLIFDTTQETDPKEQDVRRYTNQLLALTLMGEDTEHGRVEPPYVLFVWGELMLFQAVVQQVSISYTLFMSNGKPIRARAQVHFIQLDLEDDLGESTNPTSRTEPRKTRVVQDGDRLDLIAYQEYGHPAHWRYLAQSNNLGDPFDLRPGQILIVPPLP